MLSSHKLSGRNYFAFKRALHNIFDATLICGSKLTLCTDECSWGYYGLIKSCKLCLWFDLFPDDGFPNSNLWLKENDGVSSAQVLVEYARVLMLFSQHRFCGYSWSCHKFFPPTQLTVNKKLHWLQTNFFVGRIMKMVLSTQTMCLVCWGQLKSHFRPTNLCSLKMCPQIFEVTQFHLSTEIFCGLGTAALKWRKSHPTLK